MISAMYEGVPVNICHVQAPKDSHRMTATVVDGNTIVLTGSMPKPHEVQYSLVDFFENRILALLPRWKQYYFQPAANWGIRLFLAHDADRFLFKGQLAVLRLHKPKSMLIEGNWRDGQQSYRYELWLSHADSEKPITKRLKVIENLLKQAAFNVLDHFFNEALIRHADRQVARQWSMLTTTTTLGNFAARSRKVSLTWKLIFFDEAFIRYVVEHEFAHAVHMDHSKAFWATVAQSVPNYAQLKYRQRYAISCAPQLLLGKGRLKSEIQKISESGLFQATLTEQAMAQLLRR